MAAITLENLSKHFGVFAALKELDLEVRDHEFMALLGPSGCGKTTTMNLISGLLHPSAGRILFDTRDVTPIPMGRRGVGFVFQNYAIFTHMTVRDNLAFGLRVRRLPRSEIDRRVGAIAEMMQLTKLLDSRTDKLSVNILQRIAIGRSAIVEPAIFLLDEPLSNVDAKVRHEMRIEIRRVQQESGVAAIYVTHDQSEALAMSDRIVVMNHGRIEQVGSPEEIYRRPASAFVADFMGCNLLAGELRGGSVVLPGLGMRVDVAGLPAAQGAAEVAAHVEDVHILPAAGPDTGRARVLATSFLGERAEIEVECADGRRMTGVLDSRGALPAKGAEVGVRLDAAHLWVIGNMKGK
jgi:multiple sugar transport system ATP-binding protein